MYLPQQNSQNTIEKYTFQILDNGLEKFYELIPAIDQIVVANNVSLSMPRLIDQKTGIVSIFIAYDQKVNLLNTIDCASVLLRDCGVRRRWLEVEKIQGASVTARKLLKYERDLREAIAA